MDGTKEKYYGQVKWFKDHRGYGFIGVLGRFGGGEIEHGLSPGKEIFVHHTDVHPTTSTYKTLFKGEYVSFWMKKVSRPRPFDPSATEIQASDVRGAFGGALMCDSINSNIINRVIGAPQVLQNGDIMFACGEDVIL